MIYSNQMEGYFPIRSLFPWRDLGFNNWLIGWFWNTFCLVWPPLCPQCITHLFTSKITLLGKDSSQDIWQGWSDHLCKIGDTYQGAINISVLRIDKCWILYERIKWKHTLQILCCLSICLQTITSELLLIFINI